MKTNYHTHTFRCGHAVGKDEDYVLQAIANGYNELGFSDHLMIEGLNEDSTMRGSYKELEGYINSIRFLQQKYASQIKIYVGLECEYFPQLHSYLQELLNSKKVDYLIFGNHYQYYNNKRIYGYFGRIHSQKELYAYRDLAILAIQSGLFKFFAHPDLFMNNYPVFDEVCQEISFQICQEAKKYNLPLEINQGGVRNTSKRLIGDIVRYPYPYPKFWEIAQQVGNSFIVSVDAHRPTDFSHQAVKIVEEFVKMNHFQIIDKLEF